MLLVPFCIGEKDKESPINHLILVVHLLRDKEKVNDMNKKSEIQIIGHRE
jgi:hypothetical protein